MRSFDITLGFIVFLQQTDNSIDTGFFFHWRSKFLYHIPWLFMHNILYSYHVIPFPTSSSSSIRHSCTLAWFHISILSNSAIQSFQLCHSCLTSCEKVTEVYAIEIYKHSSKTNKAIRGRPEIQSNIFSVLKFHFHIIISYKEASYDRESLGSQHCAHWGRRIVSLMPIWDTEWGPIWKLNKAKQNISKNCWYHVNITIKPHVNFWL